MNCTSCGAALPTRTVICNYCGTLNDVDLRRDFRVRTLGEASRKVCPHCDVLLSSTVIAAGQQVVIERCEKCLGLFFDPAELDMVTKSPTASADEVDLVRLTHLVEEETPNELPGVKYVKCPTCRELMNRRQYGTRSGVIVDECADHGVWLDRGELRRILVWVRAGGPGHSDLREAERERAEARARKIDAAFENAESRHQSYYDSSHDDPLDDLISRLSAWFSR